jgi:hypothetical protein
MVHQYLTNIFSEAKTWDSEYKESLPVKIEDVFVGQRFIHVQVGNGTYRKLLSWYKYARRKDARRLPLRMNDRLTPEQLEYKRKLQEQFVAQYGPGAGITTRIRWEAHVAKIRTKESGSWSKWTTYELDAATMATLRA